MTIKEYRTNLKMTPEEIASKIDLSKRQYYRLEENPQKTHLETFKKLVEVLNISDADIIRIIRNQNGTN